jgi:hypothetical protein
MLETNLKFLEFLEFHNFLDTKFTNPISSTKKTMRLLYDVCSQASSMDKKTFMGEFPKTFTHKCFWE